MFDPLIPLLLVLALAAGLASAVFVAQQVTEDRSGFHRFYLTQILLFNLLVLGGLVYRHLQLQAHTALHPAVLPLLIGLMAALKLGWLFAFVASAQVLAGKRIDNRSRRRATRAGFTLVAVYATVIALAWMNNFGALVSAAVIIFETLILGGAMLGAWSTIHEARRIPGGPRRTSLKVYGGFHLGLLSGILAVMLASWILPARTGQAPMVISGIFMLLFNLFPPIWMRKFQPTLSGPESGKFESMGITRRERQIIRLIQAGRTNQEIADELFISLATVKDHNNNLFRKCGVRNRVELANLFR